MNWFLAPSGDFVFHCQHIFELDELPHCARRIDCVRRVRSMLTRSQSRSLFLSFARRLKRKKINKAGFGFWRFVKCVHILGVKL